MAIPIVVGVADVVNRSLELQDAREPMQLMVEAIQRAIEDIGLSQYSAQKLRSSITSIFTVRCWTWPYPDLPGLLAEQLNVSPRNKRSSTQGGHNPALLFDEAARSVSLGESKVAIITGGEALASCKTSTSATSRNSLTGRSIQCSHGPRPTRPLHLIGALSSRKRPPHSRQPREISV